MSLRQSAKPMKPGNLLPKPSWTASDPALSSTGWGQDQRSTPFTFSKWYNNTLEPICVYWVTFHKTRTWNDRFDSTCLSWSMRRNARHHALSNNWSGNWIAAIRKVLSGFLARDPISDALLNKEFQSVHDVLEAVGQTNEAGKSIAKAILDSFRPCLILNRMGTGSKVNTLHLQQMVQQYIGADLRILGHIPQDQNVERSIRQYLPVVEYAPQCPASRAFEQLVGKLEEWIQTDVFTESE